MGGIRSRNIVPLFATLLDDLFKLHGTNFIELESWDFVPFIQISPRWKIKLRNNGEEYKRKFLIFRTIRYMGSFLQSG